MIKNDDRNSNFHLYLYLALKHQCKKRKPEKAHRRKENEVKIEISGQRYGIIGLQNDPNPSNYWQSLSHNWGQVGRELHVLGRRPCLISTDLRHTLFYPTWYSFTATYLPVTWVRELTSQKNSRTIPISFEYIHENREKQGRWEERLDENDGKMKCQVEENDVGRSLSLQIFPEIALVLKRLCKEVLFSSAQKSGIQVQSKLKTLKCRQP